MKASTAYRHRKRAISKLNQLLAGAVEHGMTSQAMTDARNVIYRSVSHCPRWVIEYIDGWFSGRLDLLRESGQFSFTAERGLNIGVSDLLS